MARLFSLLALLVLVVPLNAEPLHHHPRRETDRHEWMEHHPHHHGPEPVLGLSPGLCHDEHDGGDTTAGGTQTGGGSSQSVDPVAAEVKSPPQIPEPHALLLAGLAVGLWGCRRFLIRV